MLSLYLLHLLLLVNVVLHMYGLRRVWFCLVYFTGCLTSLLMICQSHMSRHTNVKKVDMPPGSSAIDIKGNMNKFKLYKTSAIVFLFNLFLKQGIG